MLTIDNTSAELVAINITKIGGEDEDKLILKARFSTVITADTLRRIMGLDTIPAFWDTDDEKNPLYWTFEGIDLTGKFKNQGLTFSVVSFDSCEISKMRVLPIPGALCAISFTARVAFPSPDKVAAMAARLRYSFALSVTADPDLFEGGE